MKKNNNRKGFTTVELVIVIAVIAILAAVMIPTFSGLVEKAQNSAILQEARNAYSQYVIDKTGPTTFSTDGWIKVVNGTKTYYVEVKDGALQEADPYTETKTDAMTVLTCNEHTYLEENSNGKCKDCNAECTATHTVVETCQTCNYIKPE